MPSAQIKASIRRASKTARANIRRLDNATRAQLSDLYTQAADSVSAQIMAAEDIDGSIRLERLQTLKNQINVTLLQLDNQRDDLFSGAIRSAADIGVSPFIEISGSLYELADEAVRQTVHFIAADGLQLSDRIWRLNQGERDIIANQVEQATIRGDSAARAAREFVQNNVEVPAALRAKIGESQASKIAAKTGTELARGSAYKNALRLFRTEINRAHGEAYMAAAFDSDEVIGTRFLLSPNHPEADICDMHARVNRYGLGSGVYPRGKNPWPAHPNTLSFVEVVFADEVSAADKTGQQKRIDWIQQQPAPVQKSVLGHGMKVAALQRGLITEGQINTPWSRLKPRYERHGHNPDAW